MLRHAPPRHLARRPSLAQLRRMEREEKARHEHERELQRQREPQGVVQPSHLRIRPAVPRQRQKLAPPQGLRVRRARPQPIRPRRACTTLVAPPPALFVSPSSEHGQSDAVLLVRRGDEEICRIRRERERQTKQRKKQRRQRELHMELQRVAEHEAQVYSSHSGFHGVEALFFDDRGNECSQDEASGCK